MSLLLRALVRQEGPYFPVDFPDAARRVFRRNFVGHTLDGGLYGFGITLVSLEAVLPALLASLGAPSGLIGFVPQLVLIGFALPPLFTAHLVASMPRVKPFVLRFGALQRLPYLLAGLVLLFGDRLPSALVVTIVFATPLVSALLGGVAVGAWNTLFAKCIPPSRRSSAAAARNTLAAVLGLTGGLIVTAVLARFPVPAAYGVLHLIAFGILALSLLSFTPVREPEHTAPVSPRRSFRESFPDYLAALRTDARLRSFLLARGAVTGFGLVTPFLSIHTLAALTAEPALLGRLTIAVVTGRIVGNLASAVIGDRRGGGALSRLGLVVLIATCLAFPFARQEWAFLALFAAWGLGQAMDQNASITLIMEVAPLQRLAAYFSIYAICMVPLVLVIGGLAGPLYELGERLLPGTLALPAAFAALSLGAAVFWTARLRLSAS